MFKTLAMLSFSYFPLNMSFPRGLRCRHAAPVPPVPRLPIRLLMAPLRHSCRFSSSQGVRPSTCIEFVHRPSTSVYFRPSTCVRLLAYNSIIMLFSIMHRVRTPPCGTPCGILRRASLLRDIACLGRPQIFTLKEQLLVISWILVWNMRDAGMQTSTQSSSKLALPTNVTRQQRQSMNHGGGEDTVDWDTVGSNCSIENCSPN